MLVYTEPDNNATPPSIKLYSDAPTEQEAMREIKSWAILNKSAQLREPHLQTEAINGLGVYVGRAYHIGTIADEGNRIYETIADALETSDLGRVVAIDILLHDYVVANNLHDASQELTAKHPEAVPYIVKIGYNVVASIGGAVTRTRRS